MSKEFIIKVSTYIKIPFGDGLMDDQSINTNHIMYVAQKYIEDHPEVFKSDKLMYQIDYMDGKEKLTLTPNGNISCKNVAENKKKILCKTI